MVGWERSDVEEIPKIWRTKRQPWFVKTKNYDEFNAKWVNFYKNYTPTQLVTEWEMWQNKVSEEIDRIGYQNIKSRPDLFDWLLEDEDIKDLSRGNGHYAHHYRQIKRVVEYN